MSARAEIVPSLVERIKQTMVGLKMPRAIEILDTIVRRLEHGEITALEAIDALLSEEFTRSSLLHPAATPLGSLTPAEAPLIDAEKLFRQTGPALLIPGLLIVPFGVPNLRLQAKRRVDEVALCEDID